MSDKAMSLKEAAEYLGLELSTLYNWRVKQIGPPSYALSPRKIIYRKKEIDRWLEERKEVFDGSDKAS
jgi:predicted DNA-binding transcriptional regulator AlpA